MPSLTARLEGRALHDRLADDPRAATPTRLPSASSAGAQVWCSTSAGSSRRACRPRGSRCSLPGALPPTPSATARPRAIVGIRRRAAAEAAARRTWCRASPAAGGMPSDLRRDQLVDGRESASPSQISQPPSSIGTTRPAAPSRHGRGRGTRTRPRAPCAPWRARRSASPSLPRPPLAGRLRRASR